MLLIKQTRKAGIKSASATLPVRSNFPGVARPPVTHYKCLRVFVVESGIEPGMQPFQDLGDNPHYAFPPCSGLSRMSMRYCLLRKPLVIHTSVTQIYGNCSGLPLFCATYITQYCGNRIVMCHKTPTPNQSKRDYDSRHNNGYHHYGLFQI